MRDLFDRHVGDLQPSTPIEAVRRRAQRGRLLVAISSVTAVVVFAVAAVMITGSFDPQDQNRSVAPVPSPDEDASPGLLGNGCPRSRGKMSGSRWTSATVRVASGSNDGQQWVLCARTVERTQGEDRGVEAVCTDWLYGDGGNSGMTCVFRGHGTGRAIPLDESYFDVASGPEGGYFFGAAPSATRSVELETPSGERIPGDVHPAPDALDVPFQFFTLFAEPFTQGTLLLYDEDGELIRRRVMEHGLSQLAVTKDGDGEGTVTGFRTELLYVYESCKSESDDPCRKVRPAWINCGDDCDAALADARITLIAEFAEGSRFVGWLGACTGTGRCELTVDENLTVTAVFEASP